MIILIKGDAGTGKSYLLEALRNSYEKDGSDAVFFDPVNHISSPGYPNYLERKAAEANELAKQGTKVYFVSQEEPTNLNVDRTIELY